MKRSLPGFGGPAALALILVLAMGCTAPQQRETTAGPETAMIRLASKDFPEFGDAMAFDSLAYAVGQSQRYFKRLAPETPFRFGPDTYSASHLTASLARFLEIIRDRPDAGTLNRRIAAEYTVYKAAGRSKPAMVLFTGYYEPLLSGSPVRTETHRYPIYARPQDLVEADLSLFSKDFKGKRIAGRLDGRALVPYYDRHQIDVSGALNHKARVLAWVQDPVNRFFLHIQGSGRILMTDGTTLNVHFAGTNGKPYRSIGRLLIDRGAISAQEMSMQAIRSWLTEHPDQMDAIFDHNPSYVFFETVASGPLGCIDVLLTPGRSVATDRRIFPMGALAYVAIDHPLIDGGGEIRSWRRLDRFVLNQDTGGAIRGPGRADLFFGGGDYAETAAGHLKHDGDLFFLVLRRE